MNDNPFDNDENPHGLEQDDNVKFHGWRLLGVIGCVILALAVISAVVDILVIGPLEGRF